MALPHPPCPIRVYRELSTNCQAKKNFIETEAKVSFDGQRVQSTDKLIIIIISEWLTMGLGQRSRRNFNQMRRKLWEEENKWSRWFREGQTWHPRLIGLMVLQKVYYFWIYLFFRATQEEKKVSPKFLLNCHTIFSKPTCRGADDKLWSKLKRL